VRAGDESQLLWGGDPDEGHELLEVVAVGAVGVRVVDVGELPRSRRHLGEPVEFGSSECPMSRYGFS